MRRSEKSVQTDCSGGGEDGVEWCRLEECTEELKYSIRGYQKSNVKLDKLRKTAIRTRNENMEQMDALEHKISQFGNKVGDIKTQMDKKINQVLREFDESFGRPQSPATKAGLEEENGDYTTYEDLLKRFELLSRQLGDIENIKNISDKMLEQVELENEMYAEMNERIEEMRYNWKLRETSEAIAASTKPADPLYNFFILPSLLTALIVKHGTCPYYSDTLARLNRRVLGLIQMIQRERNPNSMPLNVISTLATARTQTLGTYFSKNVPHVTPNEVIPPPRVDILPPTIRDSQMEVSDGLKHGEVVVPADVVIPIAKDSATTLGSKASPTPCLQNGESLPKTEQDKLIAKDSVHKMN